MHPKIKAWLERHPRFHLPLPPTSPSLIHLIARFFGPIEKDAIKRGVFPSVADLEAAIKELFGASTPAPLRFIWTSKAAGILDKVARKGQA